MDHRLSVVVTTYNQEMYVSEALESVLAQTRRPDELVVVDDASTDDTPAIVQGYADEYPDLVDVHLLDEEQGIPQTRNYALAQVTGDLVTYLDGDDRFHSEKLATEYRVYTEHPDCRLVFSNFEYIDDAGDVFDVWANDDDNVPTGNVFRECLTRAFPDENLFRDELVAVDAIREVGGYDENLPILEDWELRIRLTANERVAYCPDLLTAYRRTDGGVSRRTNYATSAELVSYVVDKHREHAQQELPPAEARDIDRDLDKLVAKYRMLAAAEERRPLRTLRHYLSFVANDPTELLKIRRHL